VSVLKTARSPRALIERIAQASADQTQPDSPTKVWPH